MSTVIIITICILLLIAYAFDLTSPKTKIPTAILLLLLGWLGRQAATYFDFQLPNISSALPVLGTIGLILIVFEGSLELELNRSKFNLIKKSAISATLPLLALSFGLAYIFQWTSGESFRNCLVNSIPLSVISSAIAIPSVRYFAEKDREFVTYESSFSDIIGVLFFNFLTQNEVFRAKAFSLFFLQILLILAISFVAVVGLSFMLSRLKHHIKFFPFIIIIVLIYAVSKIFHLPGLIFILVFGIFLGNLDEIKEIKLVKMLHPDKMQGEVKKLKEITVEATFLVRSIFFLLFGYLIETKEIVNPETLLWSMAIVSFVYLLRFFQLRVLKLPAVPLVYIAPRGLITILLFLSIEMQDKIELVNRSMIIQVVILSILILAVGSLKKQAVKNAR